MRYLGQMFPNAKLVARAIRDLSFPKLVFHGVNNTRTDIFQPRSDYDRSELIVPNAIYLEPTTACDRRCEGCYVPTSGIPSIMNPVLAQHVFDAASTLRVNYVAWFGGEPLLPPVREMTLSVSERNPKVAVVICTNGDFLDDHVADRIANTDNMAAFISTDGFEKTHDQRRGEGSYKQVLQATDRLRKKRALFGYVATLTSANFREVTSEPFVDEMIARGAFIGSYTLFLSDSFHPLQLQPGQFAEAISALNELSARKPLYILSADFGRLRGGTVMKGKRLSGLTVDPQGGVRTERGGKPLDFISPTRTLVDIIKGESLQSIFVTKANGSPNAPHDSGRKTVIEEAYQLMVVRAQ